MDELAAGRRQWQASDWEAPRPGRINSAAVVPGWRRVSDPYKNASRQELVELDAGARSMQLRSLKL